MKLINLLPLFAIILSACHEDENVDINLPDLADGTCQLEIFNTQGEKVFTREVSANGLGSWWYLEIRDPKFGSSLQADSLETFADLFLFTGRSMELPWNRSSHWTVGKVSAGAYFSQRFYSLSSDWQYESVSGQIRILESTDTVMKGYFKIKMRVPPPDQNSIGWSTNPKWGEQITVIVYFASKDW